MEPSFRFRTLGFAGFLVFKIALDEVGDGVFFRLCGFEIAAFAHRRFGLLRPLAGIGFALEHGRLRGDFQ